MPDDLVVGVDLGGTKILASLVDHTGRPVQFIERPTPTSGGREVCAALEEIVSAALETHAERGACRAIGVGIPACFDRDTRAPLRASNLLLGEVDIAGSLSDRFGLPVVLENDANVVAFAEWRCGAGQDARTVVALTLGTGVGGGLVLDRQLYRGWFEAGHVVIDAGGAACQGSCTGHGHLEALASGSAAGRLAQVAYGADVEPPELLERARSGDPVACGVIEELGTALGNGVASLVSLFDPDVIVIGGGFGAAAADLLLPVAEATAAREAIAWSAVRPRLCVAQLGRGAGVIGAALLAHEELS